MNNTNLAEFTPKTNETAPPAEEGCRLNQMTDDPSVHPHQSIITTHVHDDHECTHSRIRPANSLREPSTMDLPTYGFQDEWSGCWVGLDANSTDYPAEFRGIPVRLATDNGLLVTTESSDHLLPDLGAPRIAPNRLFLRSAHNVAIERQWSRLQISQATCIRQSRESGSESNARR